MSKDNILGYGTGRKSSVALYLRKGSGKILLIPKIQISFLQEKLG